jgi:hypothetical protein
MTTFLLFMTLLGISYIKMGLRKPERYLPQCPVQCKPCFSGATLATLFSPLIFKGWQREFRQLGARAEGSAINNQQPEKVRRRMPPQTRVVVAAQHLKTRIAALSLHSVAQGHLQRGNVGLFILYHSI